MKQLFFIHLTGLVIFQFTGKAQVTDTSDMITTKVITFHSKILNEDRRIYIYKPKVDSAYLSESAYPVLYLMDAGEQMGMVVGQVAYLSESYSIIPPMVIVGIGNIDRTKDLTPTHATTGNNGKHDTSMAATLRTSGGGTKFLQFLREELMPYVDQHYKTAPFKIFSGHSLGGLMSVYTLTSYPDMFNAYIAISPSLWWDEQYVLKLANNWQPNLKSKKLLFLSDGSEGGQFHKDALSLHSILKNKQTRNLSINYTYYPKESHTAEPVKATYDALRYIFQPVYPPQFDTLSSFIYFKPDMIINYYKDLSAKNGYEIKPPEAVIDRLAHYLSSLNTKQSNKDAITLLTLNVNNYPLSWHVHYSLGEIHHDRMHDTQRAINHYKTALKLNPNNKKLAETIQKLGDGLKTD